MKRIESELILDEWSEFKASRKLSDNGSNRDAFLNSKDRYVSAQDRIDMLMALESLIDGKIKIFQEVRRHIRKQIDILLRGIAFEKYTS